MIVGNWHANVPGAEAGGMGVVTWSSPKRRNGEGPVPACKVLCLCTVLYSNVLGCAIFDIGDAGWLTGSPPSQPPRIESHCVWDKQV